MKIQTSSVRTWSFVHFILPWICLQTRQFDTGFSEGLKLKDDAVLTILDQTVMSQHTSVSYCFNYVVTIALSVIADRLICIEYLCVFDLNHSSVHL